VQYIALTGYMGSGKGVLSDMLKQSGYKYVSLSDIVREEATSRGLEHTRENLQNIGNELRSQYGAGVLGMKVRETITREPDQKWVVDGVRNPACMDELRELPGLKIVGVSADDELLVDRILDRRREGL